MLATHGYADVLARACAERGLDAGVLDARVQRRGGVSDMQRFSPLYATLDRTSSTNAKVAALEAYFREAPPEDAAWTVFFLAGRRLLRLLPTRLLREWTMETTGRRAVAARRVVRRGRGPRRDDGAAARRRAAPTATSASVPLHVWIEERLEGLRAQDRRTRSATTCVRWWRALPSFERFLLNKLLTGEMRVGVSQTLVVRALAAVAGVDTDVMTHRLMGQWSPSAQAFRR